MKKSKIIVPALALLLLSTAASVSGTVAWFTATRTFDTSISDFTATTTDGALRVEMAGGVGTTAESDKQSVSINSGVKLGDASLNHSTGELFTDTVTQNVYKSLGTYDDEHVADNWLVASGGTTYYAISWKMDFIYTFAADNAQQNLYFDFNESAMTAASTADKTGTTGKEVHKGFRIAFLGDTASVTTSKVWAGLTDAAGAVKYVSATNATTNYGAERMASDTTGCLANNAATGGTTVPNYLGKFTGNPEQEVTISFTCVAWFEGTDVNVITDSTFKKVSASMHFFVTPNA